MGTFNGTCGTQSREVECDFPHEVGPVVARGLCSCTGVDEPGQRPFEMAGRSASTVGDVHGGLLRILVPAVPVRPAQQIVGR